MTDRERHTAYRGVRTQSYHLIRRWQPDVHQHQQFIRVICAKCGEQTMLKWDFDNSPVTISKRFKEKGWRFEPFAAKNCICPRCVKGGEMAQSQPPKVVTPKEFIQEVKPPTRSLTPDERHRVRMLLDGHFDDAKGRYIDGYTDKRVGGELDIPWALVRDLREAAYGPIREDERLGELRILLAQAKAMLTDIEARMTALEKESGK